MLHFFAFVLLCSYSIACLANSVVVDQELLGRARRHLERAGISLLDSTWPADHGDISRSKYTLNAGLPADFNPEDIELIIQDKSEQAQWLYTYGNHSEYLFLIGGIKGKIRKFLSFFIHKLDSRTMEILQTFPLTSSLYLGGLMMHANGDVYCVHSNILYRFEQGDLTKFTKKRIETKLNSNAVQTNGMLVTSDGYIVVKQWSMILEDAIYLKAILQPLIIKVMIGISVVIYSITWYFVSKGKFSLSNKLFIVLPLGGLLSVLAILGYLTFTIISMNGPIDVFEFMTSNLLIRNGGGGGEVKLIDPVSLEVVRELQLAERASYARMAMYTLFDANDQPYEDAIICLGDENVYQLRWNLPSQQLYLYPEWTRRYRRRGDGSFPGTGPAIFNHSVYFTDNTYAGFLFGRTFKLFHLPLELAGSPPKLPAPSSEPHPLTRLATGPGEDPPADGLHLTSDRPGFFFFSAVISPIEGDVIVWYVFLIIRKSIFGNSIVLYESGTLTRPSLMLYICGVGTPPRIR